MVSFHAPEMSKAALSRAFLWLLPLLCACGSTPAPPPQGGAAAPEGGIRVGAVTYVPPPPPDAVAAPSVMPVTPIVPPAGGNASAANDPTDETHLQTNKKPPGGPEAESSKPLGGKKSIHQAVVDSTDGLSEADIQVAVTKQQAGLRQCYQLGMASSTGPFAGSVTLKVTINPAGAVSSVELVASSTQNGKVDSCAISQVRQIQFPAKGSTTVVSFPIDFGR